MALFQAQPVGLGPFFRPAALSGAYLGPPNLTPSALLDEKLDASRRDSETSTDPRAYAAACTPDFFLFNAERKLVYRGRMDAARPGNDEPVTGAELRAALDAVLSGAPVSERQLPSLGCNIKWRPD